MGGGTVLRLRLGDGEVENCTGSNDGGVLV